MIETLEAALEGILTPERIEALCDAVRLIEASGQSAPSDDIQEVIEIQDGLSDNNMLVSRITDVITIALNQTLEQLGVVCTAETDIPVKTAILQTVASLEDYIIPEHIVGLMNGDFSNEEVVANMVPVFTTLTVDEAVQALEGVEDGLITRLDEVISQALLLRGPLEEDLPKDNTARIAMLNRLIKAAGNDQLSVVIELSNAGIRCGRSLSLLLNNHMEAIDDMDPRVAAVELMGLVTYSDHPLEDLKRKLIELFEDFTENYNTQRLMELTINNLLPKVESK